MRIAITLCAALATFTTASLASLTVDDGKILRGKYQANGSANIAAVTVQYLPSTVHTNSRGRTNGYLTRVVSSGGVVLQQTVVRLRGNANQLRVRKRKGTFSANAVMRISDGSVFRGSFNGLTNDRLSRYFRGKMRGQKHSRFVLRSK
jgi:hypothetical protein